MSVFQVSPIKRKRATDPCTVRVDVKFLGGEKYEASAEFADKSYTISARRTSSAVTSLCERLRRAHPEITRVQFEGLTMALEPCAHPKRKPAALVGESLFGELFEGDECVVPEKI